MVGKIDIPVLNRPVFGDQGTSASEAKTAYIDAISQSSPEEIKKVQERLSKAGLYTAEGHRFHNDGILGDVTRHALYLEDSVNGDDYARQYLKDNISDKERTPQEVMQLQAALNRLGLDAGSVDGKFGKNTQEALDKFLESEKAPQASVAKPPVFAQAPEWRAPMLPPAASLYEPSAESPWLNPTAKLFPWKTDFAKATAWNGLPEAPLGPVGVNKTEIAAQETARAAAAPAPALKTETAATGNFWMPSAATEIFNFIAFPLKPFAPAPAAPSADDRAFEAAYEKTRGFEGGKADNVHDRGGKTINGISSKWWPDDYKAVVALVDAGKDQEAEAYTRKFYKENFWDELPKMGSNLAAKQAAFDASVNHGIDPGREMLRESGGDVKLIKAARQDIYKDLIEAHPTQETFAGGWANRIGVPKSSLLASTDVGPYAKSSIVFSAPAVILNEGEEGVNSRIALSEKTFPAAAEATEAAPAPSVVTAVQEPQKIMPTGGGAGGQTLAY